MLYIYKFQTVNQGQKIEFNVKVAGTKPTVTWYHNDTVKLKSGANTKITFTKEEAKLLIIESGAEHAGEYKLEAVNEFGQAVQTCKVAVIRKHCSILFAINVSAGFVNLFFRNIFCFTFYL